MVTQAVELCDVAQEDRAHAWGRGAGAVEVDVLPANIGAHADHVALVRNHEDQLVLLEQPLDGGVALALLLPPLDRHRQVAAVGEAEAENRVGDARGAPVREEEVEGAEIGEAIRAVFVADVEVGLAPIHGVSHVVHGHGVVVHLGPGQGREIRLPVAIVPGWNEKPPDEHGREEDTGERPPQTAGPDPEQDDSHGGQEQEGSGYPSGRGTGGREVQGQRPPDYAPCRAGR